MASSKLVNVISPALRMLLKKDGICPLIKFSKKQADSQLNVSIDENDSVDQVINKLKEVLNSEQSPGVLNVENLGSFEISAPEAAKARAGAKVVIVTGAAQGFGLEIAQHLADEGAYVVLADINASQAEKESQKINEKVNNDSTIAIEINVADIESVNAAVSKVVQRFGGIDVLIANAGILRAESVKTQPVKDFDLTTAVNYKGYYLCTQAVSKILAVQHQADPSCMSDIIQINSKSGLEGSNKNFAYAGSKFGGIGLTQSFALELIEDGVKVNSICPGNFFDGPLWSHPENGLFAQYLRTGKVPGAKNIGDVKKFYEAKVPMKRGCTTADVMKAIYYVIEQKYETGQAIPVTGGQVMLH